jgi:formamidopyrimidine-DNA glycosylase
MTVGQAALDPLGDHFTLAAFTGVLQRQPERPLGEVLLDHDAFTRLTAELAGQVLGQAQIAPERSAGSLSDAELHRLHRAVRDVLGRALEGHHGYGP